MKISFCDGTEKQKKYMGSLLCQLNNYINKRHKEQANHPDAVNKKALKAINHSRDLVNNIEIKNCLGLFKIEMHDRIKFIISYEDKGHQDRMKKLLENGKWSIRDYENMYYVKDLVTEKALVNISKIG